MAVSTADAGGGGTVAGGMSARSGVTWTITRTRDSTGYRDYSPRVNSRLISRMDRLVRSISMQFTLGGHADPGDEIRQLADSYTEFRNLRDDEFGTVDYRRSVKVLKCDDDRWVERSEEKVKAEGWATIAVSKGEFDGEWPFRRDCVTVECPDGLFYVVNIGGYVFALSGAGRSKYRLPFAHEAGVTVLGKSVGPFVDMAARLSP